MALEDKEAKTQDLLLYFIQKLDGALGRTKLVKLCYLTDMFHRMTAGEPVTSFQYRLFENGPFDVQFYGAVKALEQAGFIQENFVPEFNGHRYAIKKIKDFREIALSRDERYVAERVADRFGKVRLDILLDEVVYRTDPAKQAKEAGAVKEPLDMDQVNNQLKNNLGLDFETYIAAKEAQARGEQVPIEDIINSL